MMTTTVVPFPLVRRRVYIAKQAEHMTCLHEGAAARYLSRQLKVQGDALRRRGISEELIARELKCMEATIRREFESATGTA